MYLLPVQPACKHYLYKNSSTGYYKIQLVWRNCGGRFKNETENIMNNTISPNPLKQGESLSFIINSEEVKETDIDIINTIGQKVQNTRVVLQKGENNIKLGTNNLAKGIYILHNTENKINL